MKSRGRIQHASPVEIPGRSEGLRSHCGSLLVVRILDRIPLYLLRSVTLLGLLVVGYDNRQVHVDVREGSG